MTEGAGMASTSSPILTSSCLVFWDDSQCVQPSVLGFSPLVGGSWESQDLEREARAGLKLGQCPFTHLGVFQHSNSGTHGRAWVCWVFVWAMLIAPGRRLTVLPCTLALSLPVASGTSGVPGVPP